MLSGLLVPAGAQVANTGKLHEQLDRPRLVWGTDAGRYHILEVTC